jgi:hypothetical protein
VVLLYNQRLAKNKKRERANMKKYKTIDIKKDKTTANFEKSIKI